MMMTQSDQRRQQETGGNPRLGRHRQGPLGLTGQRITKVKGPMPPARQQPTGGQQAGRQPGRLQEWRIVRHGLIQQEHVSRMIGTPGGGNGGMGRHDRESGGRQPDGRGFEHLTGRPGGAAIAQRENKVVGGLVQLIGRLGVCEQHARDIDTEKVIEKAV